MAPTTTPAASAKWPVAVKELLAWSFPEAPPPDLLLRSSSGQWADLRCHATLLIARVPFFRALLLGAWQTTAQIEASDQPVVATSACGAVSACSPTLENGLRVLTVDDGVLGMPCGAHLPLLLTALYTDELSLCEDLVGDLAPFFFAFLLFSKI